MALTKAERNYINRSVASIAALKSVIVTDRRNGSIVTIAAARPDGGMFRYDTASTATEDDKIVVVPSSITPPDPGRWIRISYAEADVFEDDIKLKSLPPIVTFTQGSQHNDELTTLGAVSEHSRVAIDSLVLTNEPTGTNYYAGLVISAPGQTAFTLPSAAINPTKSLLFVNGLIYPYGAFYTISGTTLTWINTNPISLSLTTSDIIVVKIDYNNPIYS